MSSKSMLNVLIDIHNRRIEEALQNPFSYCFLYKTCPFLRLSNWLISLLVNWTKEFLTIHSEKPGYHMVCSVKWKHAKNMGREKNGMKFIYFDT